VSHEGEGKVAYSAVDFQEVEEDVEEVSEGSGKP
jgi:hypothetical protein